MRLFLLCLLVLIAFAANSVLNRAALALDQISPAAFAGIRLISGAAMLGALVWFRSRTWGGTLHWPGATALLVYAVGFSFAYISLDTGTGALILFGGVQVTMFAGALLAGERPGPFRWGGAGLGLLGLAVLFLPGATAPSALGAILMLAAAIGWGIYSLIGKSVADPLAATSANFLWAAPVAALIWALVPTEVSMTPSGFWLAVTSGAITSGLGYAVWYAVLPRIDATLAAVGQLSVPILALLGGIVFLAEPMTWRFVIAAALVISGVLLAVRSKS